MVRKTAKADDLSPKGKELACHGPSNFFLLLAAWLGVEAAFQWTVGLYESNRHLHNSLEGIMTLILGRKIGMTQLFAEDGTATGVTVVEAGPCVATQIRTQDTDGYDAIQWGFEEVRESRTNKPQIGHFKKADVSTKRFLREERLADASTVEVGTSISADVFEEGQLVDVVGTTKGRGFAGTIKRHNFARGPKTHGSKNYRAPGSIGCSAYPSRVFKGKRSSGHYGDDRQTTKNLRVMRVDVDRNLIFIKGAVPGCNTGFVQIQTAKTGTKTPKKR
jgi:large subunit ribosomal protein L3